MSQPMSSLFFHLDARLRTLNMRSYSYLQEYLEDVDTSDYDKWPLVEDPVSKDWMRIMAMTMTMTKMMVTLTRMIMMMMFFCLFA